MGLFLTMLPIYIFGNLHCIGMCGPLVMMIGHHRYRYFYFLGRIVSFTLAGMAAGALGAVLHLVLQRYHIPAVACFLFGGMILMLGVYALLGWQYPGYRWLACQLGKFNSVISTLMLRDKAWPAFLFGFFTIALPCGQTMIVFSACALAGDALVGTMNGFAFALLTSPSLFLAMHAQSMLKRLKPHHHTIMGFCAVLVGGLALARGFAEMDLIPHLVLNPSSPPYYHIVLY